MATAEEETETQRSQNTEQEVIGIGILGHIQVTPRQANDPLWLNDGSRRESGQGRVQAPPKER